MSDEQAIHFAVGVELAGARATAEVHELLARSGVEAIVIKGPVTSRWLRGGVGDRYSFDVDLLVSPRDRDAAEAALADAGYARLLDDPAGDAHADTWVRDGSFAVDLHRTVVGAHASADVVWQALWSTSVTVDVDASRCRVPGVPARGLLVALHAAQHGPRDARVLDDVELVLERLTPEEWMEAATLARAIDATDALAAGIALAPGGSELLRELGLPPPRTAQAVLRAEGAPATALGFDRLATARGVRAKLRLLLRELAPPPSYMRAWNSLARRGAAGLALSYLVRPFWLVWHGVPGALAWRRAQKRARH